ncbi:hypothetical protein A2313_02635 [Candidatus Roizmanbacteria bacterium RIFOXYB2_FULL_41_10]|uniref:PEGA domain-containing protein n=1 Tax=Candidatus Roizmanbacteria bacterium RIFOXYA1_FULL_41_12 TaxID=1802082 RepID=A0A1F7KEI1_9BACT|nr:MAG: hypothetical protein A2209_01380 [Candidatus Roizmanbacteria bacterium RIFOXYA1_FULL_41_12]OGK66723.1 MAG: hypothetical protein A2377_02335 [Candidatus Roizmanbacteria bacterium RIFOXYB1_FULL_41_27]OGK69055.1 MAG: hypothetical protein A2262_00795 [Candidatus Roizmanbacteria bacterium RIFOXYA2_FULL_41_8]OGK70635.1 MAG: hypothetical protein A2313_02635 [Candidatus Roizmanbacteria bacterium RIFOXYB2_FULL_41_10]OGK70903.1 MAG: hypothetical protein A2403_02375 [Candidatus Roizmanbacteria bac
MVYLKRSAIALLIIIAILAVAVTIILFARGYRFNLNNGELGSKGILVANSAPNNAQIYVDSKFVSLTSDNVYLSPGKYQISIRKEGYSNWNKEFTIKGEVVSRVDAQLFSSNPSLSPLTNSGVVGPYLSPLKDKVSYIIMPNETQLTLEENGGLMIGNLKTGTLNFFKQHNLLLPYSSLPLTMVPDKTQVIFSNNEKNLLAFFYDEYDNLLAVYLMSINGSQGDYLDVTLSYQQLLDQWWQEKTSLQQKIYDTAKPKLRKVLNNNTYLVEVSPDKSKFLYLALNDALLPRIIVPALIGSVPTKEIREIKAANFYVYDKKEDKNFLIKNYSDEARQEMAQFLNEVRLSESLALLDWLKLNQLFNQLTWYSDSRHLIASHNGTISVMEYDGANKILVYSGPFEENFLAASSDGRLVVLTNINPKKNVLADLYSVSIK